MKKFLKCVWSKYGINPFDRLLRQAVKRSHKRFLICWNRGLGDIALGLYALTFRIHSKIPDAKITFLTRSDLKEGFEMLQCGEVLVDPDWKRGRKMDLDLSLEKLGRKLEEFEVVIEQPDPTQWCMWQIGKLVPKLDWRAEWDSLVLRFGVDQQKMIVGVHVETQTNYGYEKNWPIENWQRLLDVLTREMGCQVLVFGGRSESVVERDGVVDLRGKTTLYEMLSLIKNCCDCLVVPDSGVLSLTYYLNCPFPLTVISLWADRKQGVLKQGVASPNVKLVHVPCVAVEGDMRTICVEDVLEKIRDVLLVKR